MQLDIVAFLSLLMIHRYSDEAATHVCRPFHHPGPTTGYIFKYYNIYNGNKICECRRTSVPIVMRAHGLHILLAPVVRQYTVLLIRA